MIQYSDSNDFDLQQLLALFEQAEWARGRSLEDTQRMLAETDVTISAWDGPQLVGFGRVLTDYVFRASIWDVIVDKELPRPRYWEKLSSADSRAFIPGQSGAVLALYQALSRILFLSRVFG